MTSLYERLARRGQLIEVEMDDLQILEPSDDEIAIGTRDLNGCSALVIVDKGVILAHIAPMSREDRDRQAASGLPHFQSMARRAVNLMRQHEKLFSEDTTTWGIFARLGADVPLSHYADWASALFAHLGFRMQPAYYDVNPRDGRERQLPKGSVVVIKQNEAPAMLYLEDLVQQPSPQQIPAAAVSRTQASTAKPSRASAANAVTSTQSRQAVHTATLPAAAAPARQIISATALPAVAAPAPASQAVLQPNTDRMVAESTWAYREGVYQRTSGTTVVEQQSSPPVNQIFVSSRGHMLWDGRKFWVHGQGRWTRM